MHRRTHAACFSPADGGGAAELGDLPVWNLDDLYEGPDAPALTRDLDG